MKKIIFVFGLLLILLSSCSYKETKTVNASGSDIIIREANYNMIEYGTYKLKDYDSYYAILDETTLTWVDTKISEEYKMPPYKYYVVSNNAIRVIPVSIHGEQGQPYIIVFGKDVDGLYLTNKYNANPQYFYYLVKDL